jgi:hypothetical protein
MITGILRRAPLFAGLAEEQLEYHADKGVRATLQGTPILKPPQDFADLRPSWLCYTESA